MSAPVNRYHFLRACRLARRNHAGDQGWNGNDRFFFYRSCDIAKVEPEAILDMIRKETAA